MFPTAFRPVEGMPLALASGTVHVPLVRPFFQAFTDTHNAHTFGGKDLLRVEDHPQFAEVAILRAFQAEGWQGRWLETSGKGKLTPGLWNEWHADGPRAQVHLPIVEAWVNERLLTIAAANGGTFSGCWDVVAWRNDRLVFAESKKRKKDTMRGTQLRWLEAALKCGCSVENFLMVEWSVGTQP